MASVPPNAVPGAALSAVSLEATLAQPPQPGDGPSRDTGVGARLGRFTILERIGAGNMGVVFTAYDDVLDRKIAVKVLRGAGEGASLRLVREAQAMARVAHPNVVTVHEVGTSLEPPGAARGRPSGDRAAGRTTRARSTRRAVPRRDAHRRRRGRLRAAEL